MLEKYIELKETIKREKNIVNKAKSQKEEHNSYFFVLVSTLFTVVTFYFFYNYLEEIKNILISWNQTLFFKKDINEFSSMNDISSLFLS